MDKCYRVIFFLLFLLYAKWLFVILFYPLMAMAAIGNRCNGRMVGKWWKLPLRVSEHFLRFGGG